MLPLAGTLSPARQTAILPEGGDGDAGIPGLDESAWAGSRGCEAGGELEAADALVASQRRAEELLARNEELEERISIGLCLHPAHHPATSTCSEPYMHMCHQPLLQEES